MIYLNEDLCKGCYLCMEMCPRKVYTPSENLNHKGIRVPVLMLKNVLNVRCVH